MRVSPAVAQSQVSDLEKVEEPAQAAIAMRGRSPSLLARVVSAWVVLPRPSRAGLRLFAPEQTRAIAAAPTPPLPPAS